MDSQISNKNDNPSGNKVTIVLIEDELFILDLYDAALKKAGFGVLTAMDGEKALEVVKSVPEDTVKLILLDVMLPKVNGLELLRKLKYDPQTKNIPIVLLTNLGDRNIITEAFQNGAQGYLMKMRITPFELVNQIQPFLQNPTFTMDYRTLTFDN